MEKYYIHLIIIGIIILLLFFILISRIRTRAIYKKYSKIKNSTSTYGKEFAIAAKKQLKLDITLALIDGELTDCYSVKSKTLMMSTGTCNSNSLAAIVIISHELGHAMQHKNKHPMLYISNFFRRLTRFTNFFIIPLALASLVCLIIGNPINTLLFQISMALFGIHCFSNLLLIPLERNASKWAMLYLKENNYLNFNEVVRAKKLLRCASQTYILNFLNGILFINVFNKRKKK